MSTKNKCTDERRKHNNPHYQQQVRDRGEHASADGCLVCAPQSLERRMRSHDLTAHDEMLMSAMLRRDPRVILVRAREHVRDEYLRGSDVTNQVSMQAFAKFWITMYDLINDISYEGYIHRGTRINTGEK